MNSRFQADIVIVKGLQHGDFPGHPFRGNQYAEGESGGLAINEGSLHDVTSYTSAMVRDGKITGYSSFPSFKDREGNSITYAEQSLSHEQRQQVRAGYPLPYYSNRESVKDTSAKLIGAGDSRELDREERNYVVQHFQKDTAINDNLNAQLRGHTPDFDENYVGIRINQARESEGKTALEGEELRKEINHRYEKAISGLDKLTQSKIPDNVVVYRGMRNISEKLGVSDHTKLVGTSFIDKGFPSTSISSDVVGRFAGDSNTLEGYENNLIVEVKLKKGDRGYYMPSLGDTTYMREHEVVLPRNTEFKVVGAGERLYYSDQIMGVMRRKYIVVEVEP